MAMHEAAAIRQRRRAQRGHLGRDKGVARSFISICAPLCSRLLPSLSTDYMIFCPFTYASTSCPTYKYLKWIFKKKDILALHMVRTCTRYIDTHRYIWWQLQQHMANLHNHPFALTLKHSALQPAHTLVISGNAARLSSEDQIWGKKR
jgi:hypothetical protein